MIAKPETLDLKKLFEDLVEIRKRRGEPPERIDLYFKSAEDAHNFELMMMGTFRWESMFYDFIHEQTRDSKS